MRTASVAIPLLSVPLASACATFAELPHAATVRDPQLVPKPSAFLEEVSVDSYARAGISSIVEKSLSDSGLFSSVSQESEEQDLRLSVPIVTNQEPMSGGLLSLLTGFLIPATDQRSVTVGAILHDPQCRVTAMGRSRHEFRTWMQLFLFPLWFTHSPASYERDLFAQLSRSAVSEALSAWAKSCRKPSP